MDFEELVVIFESICKIAKDKRLPWGERVDAMSRVVFLCDEFQNNAVFASTLPLLHDCFAFHLQDNRPGVVTSICDIIQVLSQRLRRNFEESAEFIFPYLVKLLPAKKELIYNYSNKTIQSILINVPSMLIIRLIIQMTKNPAQIVRISGFENLNNFLEAKISSESLGHVEELKNEFLETVENGFADLSSEVREKCSALYWKLYRKYPENCKRILNGLSKSKQERILLRNIELGEKKISKKVPKLAQTQSIGGQLQVRQGDNVEYISDSNKVEKELKNWISDKLYDLVNNNGDLNWKKIEQVLLELEKYCTEFSSSLELRDWKEVAAIVATFLFAESHYRIIVQAMYTFGVLLRNCSGYDDFSSILVSRNSAHSLKCSSLQEMEMFGVCMAKDYGILGALCFISQSGGTENIRSESRNILNYLSNTVPRSLLFQCCFHLIEKVQQRKHCLDKCEASNIMSGTLCLMGEIVYENPFFNEPNAYASLAEVLALVYQQGYSIKTKSTSKRILQLIYYNDCIKFSQQVNELAGTEDDLDIMQDEYIDTSLVKEILSPESLFTEEHCRKFKLAGKEREAPDLLGNIRQRGPYSLENIKTLLLSKEIQGVILEQIDLKVLDAVLCSMVYLIQYEISAEWCVYFPMIYKAFDEAIANINKLTRLQQCLATGLLLRLLIGFNQLIVLLPQMLRTRILDRKRVTNTLSSLRLIYLRKYVPNCSTLAFSFYSHLQRILN